MPQELGARCSSVVVLFCFLASLNSQPLHADERADYIRAHYTKTEVSIAVRDGAKLFTSIYTPNDVDPKRQYPILLNRTPYSVGPYGVDKYKTMLGPSEEFERSGYIFVFQDVRGRYMSEGQFVNMRPHIDSKKGTAIDESSDTYDTIDWLVQNLPKNNGRVGQWGISYPGYYTSAGAIDSHPALKAVSPQAPIADWFFDDFHRNGAFVLPMGFNFFASFGRSRPNPTPNAAPGVSIPTRDGYQFFLDLGPLSNVDKKYFHDEIGFWNDMEAHPNYDQFWKERNILPHLKNVTASVLTVGGWYDTEDLYGPLSTYAAIEKLNPNTENRIVMGPWYHGAWNRDDGQKLGQADFGFPTADWYRKQVQFPFFEHHLRDAPKVDLPEATMFETGANRWRQFDSWPPRQSQTLSLFMKDEGKISESSPDTDKGEDPFPSDPRKPVPYTTEITTAWARNYVTEDQRFASWRPDVLVYRGPVLEQPLTLAGPIDVSLWVESSSTDADWIVKIIDEFPGQPRDGKPSDPNWAAFPSGRQELVRGGVLRGRFREGFEKAVPMNPNEPTPIRFELSDILHTFQPGHRMMVHVQSSWFPFIDRNPQKFVPNIFEAKEEDFIFATHKVLRSKKFPSQIKVRVLP